MSHIPPFDLKKIIFIILIFSLFLSRGYAAEPGLKKVSFIPVWKPQAQFAGYYLAQEKGIYKKYGLDVSILPGGSEHPPIDLLKQGKADFALLWLSSGIKWRSQGLALVNIGQVVKRSGLMLIAKRSSGIIQPQDLQSKRVNLWEGDLRIQPSAFFRKYGLQVEVIPQSYSVNLFLLGGVDAVSAMWYNEYDTILNSGIDPEELTVFFFNDYGLNFPEDGIYCREETFKKDPQAARDFVKASMEGWAYAFQHREEALDIVLKYMRLAHIPANRVHQKWMLERMQDLIYPQNSGSAPGTLNKKDYEFVAGELAAGGLIQDRPDFDAFYPPPEK